MTSMWMVSGRYGECLLTEQDCKALVRSIVEAKVQKVLQTGFAITWTYRSAVATVLCGSYDLASSSTPNGLGKCSAGL